MIYIFTGGNVVAKDAKIQELKKNALTSADAIQFDCDQLDAIKLAPEELKKVLCSLPVIAPRRFIVIRSCQKLNAHNKEIIQQMARDKAAPFDLVLDFDDEEAGAFVNLLPQIKAAHFAGEKKKDVFYMTRAMTSGNAAEALKILSDLIRDGQVPLMILGALVWYWGKAKTKLPVDRFKRGLRVLQETDLNIKRSRIQPDYALELAVIKLSSLIAY